MSITTEQCMKVILEEVPDFRICWEEHVQWWGEEDPGLGNNIAAFSRYVVELIKHRSESNDVQTIFRLIERLLTEGEIEVRTAVATNCLENIINRASAGEINANTFVRLLGKESRAFCMAWDQFTGIRTPGLCRD